MMNGQANQLSEMVPVSDDSIGDRALHQGRRDLVFSREHQRHPARGDDHARGDGDGVGWCAGDHRRRRRDAGGDADAAYYRKWATEEFGAKSADALAKVYKEYFAAPSLRPPFGPPRLTSAGNAPPPPARAQQRSARRWRSALPLRGAPDSSRLPQRAPGDRYPQPVAEVDAAARGLHLTPERREEFLDRDIKDCSDAQPRWDAVWKDAVAAESLIDPTRRDYYQAAVLTMIAINRESNRMLLDVARVDEGRGRRRHGEGADRSRGCSERARTQSGAMHAAEYGKWKNWYRGDWLTGVYRTRELVQAYAESPEGSDGETARSGVMERMGGLLPHHAV